MLGSPCLGEGPSTRTGQALVILAFCALGLSLGAPALPYGPIHPAARRATAAPPGTSGAGNERPALSTPPPKPPLHEPGSTVDRVGERVFFSRDETPIPIACADCHLVTPPGTPPPDDLIRPGHSVYDAFGRGNWWNGHVTTDCGEAGEVCLKKFMGGREMSGKMRTELVEYMKSLGAPTSSPIVLRRVPRGRVKAGEGALDSGRDLFARACAACHPGGGAGTGPDLRSSKMTAEEIAELIRAGKDPMPFFQADILTDDEVSDVAAYTRSLQPAPAN